MPDVPAPCLPLSNKIAAKQAEFDQLEAELDTEGEPEVRKAIKEALNKRGLELGTLRSQLKQCVITHGPPPDPNTKPTLNIFRIEVVQAIQSFAHTVPITDGPAIVRVYVESGVTNHFDAGAGKNRWPGVKGILTLRDPSGGTPIITRNHFPASIVARPAPETSKNQASHSFNRPPSTISPGVGRRRRPGQPAPSGSEEVDVS